MLWRVLYVRIFRMFAKEAHMMNRNLVFRIEFPALDNLVAFLREDQQRQIDAITALVGAATKRLKQSSDKLQQAVSDEPKP